MSRVKIVKEAGAKPTDFENTVAKSRGRGRVAVILYRGGKSNSRAFFVREKWGSRARIKKRRGREAALKKRARVGRI